MLTYCPRLKDLGFSVQKIDVSHDYSSSKFTWARRMQLDLCATALDLDYSSDFSRLHGIYSIVQVWGGRLIFDTCIFGVENTQYEPQRLREVMRNSYG